LRLDHSSSPSSGDELEMEVEVKVSLRQRAASTVDSGG
jgi:hypothetical protein